MRDLEERLASPIFLRNYTEKPLQYKGFLIQNMCKLQRIGVRSQEKASKTSSINLRSNEGFQG